MNIIHKRASNARLHSVVQERVVVKGPFLGLGAGGICDLARWYANGPSMQHSMAEQQAFT